MTSRFLLAVPVMLLAGVAFVSPGLADEPGRPLLTIRDHRFTPNELHIPANRAFVMDVQNDDATAEEFDSADLGVEKVIAAGRRSPIRLRPLAPGIYRFGGEYHADTATGTIIVDPEK